jgi:hypothetical protein
VCPSSQVMMNSFLLLLAFTPVGFCDIFPLLF